MCDVSPLTQGLICRSACDFGRIIIIIIIINEKINVAFSPKTIQGHVTYQKTKKRRVR